jgi:hypothetical protein
VRRDDPKCQKDGVQVQNGGERFRRSGALGGPASRPSMPHITSTSWYPQVCTSLWRSTIPARSASQPTCQDAARCNGGTVSVTLRVDSKLVIQTVQVTMASLFMLLKLLLLRTTAVQENAICLLYASVKGC